MQLKKMKSIKLLLLTTTLVLSYSEVVLDKADVNLDITSTIGIAFFFNIHQ